MSFVCGVLVALQLHTSPYSLVDRKRKPWFQRASSFCESRVQTSTRSSFCTPDIGGHWRLKHYRFKSSCVCIFCVHCYGRQTGNICRIKKQGVMKYYSFVSFSHNGLRERATDKMLSFLLSLISRVSTFPDC